MSKRGEREFPWRLLVLAGWLANACTQAPIPLAAAKGTTILFPFAGSTAPIGYTSHLGSSADYIDFQRGETLFFLQNTQTGIEYTLHPRWVSRAYPDPASPAAIQDNIPDLPGAVLVGQPFALIDIPSDPNEVPPGSYTWRIENQLPVGVVEDPEENPPPRGEGDLFREAVTPYFLLGTFEVLPAPAPAPTLGLATPALSLWGSQAGQTTAIEQSLHDLIPFHTLSVDLQPAAQIQAADLVLHYPASKLRIETVYQEFTTGRSSVVRFATAPNAADATLGDLTIHLVDPTRRLNRQLKIAIDLISPADPSQPIVTAHPNDFTLDASRSHFYNQDGVEITSGSYVRLNGIW